MSFTLWHVGRRGTWYCASNVEAVDPLAAVRDRGQSSPHSLYVVVDEVSGMPTVVRTGDRVPVRPRVECSEVR